MEYKDIAEIINLLDDRYVLKSSCNERQEEIAKTFANDDKRIDLILAEQKQMRKETKSGLRFNNWLTAAVLGAIIVAIVGFYFLAS